MAHNVLSNVPIPTAWTPYGRENVTSIYVKDSVYGEKDFTEHIVAKDFSIVQNKIAIGSVTFYGITTDLQGYFTRGNRVKVFVGNTILHVFQIENVSFDTTGACLIRLEGIECKDNKRAFTDRTTYNLDNTASNTITNKLISYNDDGASPWIFEQGTITNFGNVFFRAESERRLKALMQQAEYHQADWWISWYASSSYNTDYYNIKKDRGSGTSRYTFNESGMDKNTVTLTNTEKQNNIANYIICIGAGNEITSINYHATTNRTYLNGGDTWLTTAITATDTTINVSSTDGFYEDTGHFKIGTEIIQYTAITATSFTGCTRGDESTTAISHSVGSEVLAKNSGRLKVDDYSSLPSTGTVWVGSEQISYAGKDASFGYNWLTGITRGVNNTPIYAHMDNIEVWDEQYTTTSSQSGSSIYTNGLIEEKYDFRSVIDRNTLDLAAQNLLFERKNISKNIVVVPAKMYTILDNEKLVCGDTVTVDAELADLDGDYEIKGIRVYQNIGSQEMCELDLGEARVLDAVTQISDAKMISRELSSYAQGTYMQLQDSESDNCDNGFNIDLDVFVPKETIAIKNMNLYYNIDSYRVYSTTTTGGSSHTHSTSISSGGGHTHSVPNHQHLMFSKIGQDPEGQTLHTDYGASASGQSGGLTIWLGTEFVGPTALYTSGDSGSVTAATNNHTHGAETSSADTSHTHAVTYGISEVAAEGGNDISVYIDGTDKTSAIESLYGTLSTSSMNEVNLADSSIFTFEAGKRYTISVRPTKKCWIHAGVIGEIFRKTG